MDKKSKEESANLDKALQVWAKRNGISPKKFHQAMDWSYPYAWRVLRGYDSFRPAAWGPFIHAYGMNSLLELFRIAGVNPDKKLF